MNKAHKKLGFFQKIILAITDFRFYPVMLKTEKTSKSVAHFILFLLLLTGSLGVHLAEVALALFIKLAFGPIIPPNLPLLRSR